MTFFILLGWELIFRVPPDLPDDQISPGTAFDDQRFANRSGRSEAP